MPVPDPEIKAEVIDIEGDGSDWTIMMTFKFGLIYLEYFLEAVPSCSAAQWDKFLDGETTYIGPSPKKDWISSYCDSDTQETWCQVRGFNRESSLSMYLPSRILMPPLRAAVHELFRNLEAAKTKKVTTTARAAKTM